MREEKKNPPVPDGVPVTGGGSAPDGVPVTETSSQDTFTSKEKVLCALAVVFALAGVVLQLVPGTNFLGKLSLFIALMCAGWIYLDRWAARDAKGRLCRRVVTAGLAAGVFLFAVLEGYIVTRGGEDWTALPADAVIVLGAGVNGTVPSATLQMRIETAAAYLAAHPDIPAVLSGGQGPGEDIPEAEAMRDALLSLGVDGDRLILEDKSTSTSENLSYSKEMLEARGVDTENGTIAVVTNGFHIARMKLLAERKGIGAVGIPAPEAYGYLAFNDYVREAFALAKSLLLDW